MIYTPIILFFYPLIFKTFFTNDFFLFFHLSNKKPNSSEINFLDINIMITKNIEKSLKKRKK